MPTYRVPVIFSDLYHVTVEAKSKAHALRTVLVMPSSKIEEEGKLKDREVRTLSDEIEQIGKVEG
jgi:hypothetical protein